MGRYMAAIMTDITELKERENNAYADLLQPRLQRHIRRKVIWIVSSTLLTRYAFNRTSYLRSRPQGKQQQGLGPTPPRKLEDVCVMMLNITKAHLFVESASDPAGAVQKLNEIWQVVDNALSFFSSLRKVSPSFSLSITTFFSVAF